MPPTRTLEDEICDKYEQCRRQFHPHYHAGNRHDEHWAKAAELCRQIDADPRIFVEAQFEMPAEGGTRAVPFPSQIHSVNAVPNYNRYVENFRSKAKEGVANQFRRLASLMENFGLTIDQAVADPLQNFRPYFRVLVCSDEALETLEASWGEVARRELEVNPDLKNYLRNNYGIRAIRIIRQDIPGEAGSTHHPVPPPSPITRERALIR